MPRLCVTNDVTDMKKDKIPISRTVKWAKEFLAILFEATLEYPQNFVINAKSAEESSGNAHLDPLSFRAALGFFAHPK